MQVAATYGLVKKIHARADWFDRDTELAWAVDVMMARAKRIYILMMFLFSTRNFLKEIENMFSVFLSSFSINLLANLIRWLATLLTLYSVVDSK